MSRLDDDVSGKGEVSGLGDLDPYEIRRILDRNPQRLSSSLRDEQLTPLERHDRRIKYEIMMNTADKVKVKEGFYFLRENPWIMDLRTVSQLNEDYHKFEEVIPIGELRAFPKILLAYAFSISSLSSY